LFTLLIPVNEACSKAQEPEENHGCFYVTNGFGLDGSTEVRAETVVSGLEVPWAIAFLPGGDLLVTNGRGGSGW
jgi:glucose/arabinose dehydrogenase